MNASSYANAHRTLAISLLVVLLSGAAAAQPSADSEYAVDFELALSAYERNHWQEAYTAFAALADRGHAESARIAVQMARRGPALYGTVYRADDEQLRRWARLAACNGGSGEAGCSAPKRTH